MYAFFLFKVLSHFGVVGVHFQKKSASSETLNNTKKKGGGGGGGRFEKPRKERQQHFMTRDIALYL